MTIHKTEEEPREENFNFMQKYPINTATDPKVIFGFPFLTQSDTISYIKEHGRVMFVIRGPPFTKKTALSNILTETYPDAVYCSAVKSIDKYIPQNHKGWAGTEIILETHKICMKKAEIACLENKSTIIIQNTNIEKRNFEFYLKLAAEHDYTVIMAITMYKFNFTPEAIQDVGDLDKNYVRAKIQKFEDVFPFFTGWFISDNDSDHIRYSTLRILETLFEDEEFCTYFRMQSTDGIRSYFHPRKVLNCMAGYTNNSLAMKKYYLSDKVQASYGKVFAITLVGYLITNSDVIGIVQMSNEMKSLVLSESDYKKMEIKQHFSSNNFMEYGKHTDFPKQLSLPQKTTIVMQNWKTDEEINADDTNWIHLAQKSLDMVDLQNIKNKFNDSLQLASDKNSGVIRWDSATKYKDCFNKIGRLPNDVWLVKAPRKMCIKTIFTGFYT